MHFDEIAKTLQVSKKKVLEQAKELEKEIMNVRIEKVLDFRKRSGATKFDVLDTRSVLVGAALKELKKRLSKEVNDLENIPTEKLIKIISDESSKLDINRPLYTGREKLPDLILTHEETIDDDF